MFEPFKFHSSTKARMTTSFHPKSTTTLAGGVMSCRLSWAGPATQLGDFARPVQTLCAESRFQPLAVGYLRLGPTDPPGHTDALSARLRVSAHARGLALAEVHTEHVNVSASREGAASCALVEALRRPHINTMIIPTSVHSSRFGGMYRAMCTVIAVETGANVLIMSQLGGIAS